MEGWIKLHRKLVDWEWYNDKNVKIVFLHLLLTVNHKEKQWKGQTILRGQKLTSIEHLADEVGLTIQQTRTALKKLKSTREITIKTTSKNTLITVEKFNNYQSETDEDNKQNNKQVNNSITNKQQTNNKQITTTKNDKKDKNEQHRTAVSGSRVDGLQKNNENDSCVDSFQRVIEFYNNNIGAITPFGAEVISDYLKDMPEELIMLAMKKAVEADARSIRYIKGILNSWHKRGIKTVLEAEKEGAEFKKKNEQKAPKVEQREYSDNDFNNLYANVKEEDKK